jgi:hypothetical protein
MCDKTQKKIRMTQMRTEIYLATILTIVTLMFSCSGQSGEKSNESLSMRLEPEFSSQNADSTELTNLIRQVYEWHMTKRLSDFPYKYDEQRDSIFIGIDWDKYQKNIELFKQANFFSRGFFHQHKNIALTLDSSIRKADISWRNINDGIPVWDSGANDWCNCQDHPDDYWKMLTIDSLIIKNENAEFNWTWDREFTGFYKVTAVKEDGIWKINSLEGLNNDLTVDHYDKIMNN